MGREGEGQLRQSVTDARFQALLLQHDVKFSMRKRYWELYEKALMAEPLPPRRPNSSAIPARAFEQVSAQ